MVLLETSRNKMSVHVLHSLSRQENVGLPDSRNPLSLFGMFDVSKTRVWGTVSQYN